MPLPELGPLPDAFASEPPSLGPHGLDLQDPAPESLASALASKGSALAPASAPDCPADRTRSKGRYVVPPEPTLVQEAVGAIDAALARPVCDRRFNHRVQGRFAPMDDATGATGANEAAAHRPEDAVPFAPDGTPLILSTSTNTGYHGVYRLQEQNGTAASYDGSRRTFKRRTKLFRAKHMGKVLGNFATALEAAIAVAQLGAPRPKGRPPVGASWDAAAATWRVDATGAVWEPSIHTAVRTRYSQGWRRFPATVGLARAGMVAVRVVADDDRDLEDLGDWADGTVALDAAFGDGSSSVSVPARIQAGPSQPARPLRAAVARPSRLPRRPQPEPLSAYEQQRLQNIARNNAVLAQIGLGAASVALRPPSRARARSSHAPT